MTMVTVCFTFGRHNGQPVEDVPTDYLLWCLRECKRLDQLLADAIREELYRRRHGGRRTRGGGENKAQAGPLAILAAVLATWYREMSLKHHPDRGGSNEVMQIINDLYDRLKRVLGT
jgi:hypothetical protein